MNITISVEHVCAGGEHITLSAVRDARAKRTTETTSDVLRAPITDDEFDTAVVVLAKLALSGLTKNQARTKLQDSFVVNIP